MKKPMFHDDRPYKFFLETEEYEEKETSSSSIQKFQRIEYREAEKPREIKVERRTMHQMFREVELEPLRKISPKVIGNLFDRVEFLRQRISETQAALETRKRLHEEIIKEIDADIADKQRMVAGLSDIDDIRDFKLDISTLRMEKRRENVQFWRDILQLRTELRELMEQYRTESKIAELFKELKEGV
jgi:hypothetical protein